MKKQDVETRNKLLCMPGEAVHIAGNGWQGCANDFWQIGFERYVVLSAQWAFVIACVWSVDDKHKIGSQEHRRAYCVLIDGQPWWVMQHAIKNVHSERRETR